MDYSNEDVRNPNTGRLYRTYHVEDMITPQTPPAFIFVGDADNLQKHAARFKAALEKSGVPVELHVYEGARHGFGLHGAGPEAAWPEHCAAWLRARGFIPAGG
jgi:acetyl esterase/lipase